MVCSLVGAFGFLAYLYRAPLVAAVGFGTQVSLPAAGGLLILGVGIISAGPDHSLMRLLRDPGMAGGAARRIMPAVLIVAPLAGALEVTLERAGLADAPVATIGMVAGVAGVIFAVAWWALIPGRAAETALRASEERFRVFFEKTPDYAYLVSADRRLLDVNPAALAVLGYERDELVGRPLETIYAPESVGRLAELFDTWKATGHLTNEEMTILSRSGERRIVLVSAGVAGNEAGRPQPSIAVQRDVTDLRRAEGDLRLEVRIRTALADSLHMIPPEATLAEAAQVICDELVRLPFIDMASVDAFIGSDDVQIVGHSAPSGHPMTSGDYLPASRAALVRERAAAGPWAQYVAPDPADGGWLEKSVEAGLKAVAYGPIVHGDHVGGAVVIGTYDERFRTHARGAPVGLHVLQYHLERAPGGAPPRVSPGRRTCAGPFPRSLRPVRSDPCSSRTSTSSQATSAGYEALTRFDSGERPDLCFADAWSVGLGPDLEMASLELAVSAARGLPAGRWLNLNVSPRMLADPGRLKAVLGLADQPLVLEITEHEVIDDYEAVREAIHTPLTRTSASRWTTREQGSPTSATSSPCTRTS